jgi:hypothetical protein
MMELPKLTAVSAFWSRRTGYVEEAAGDRGSAAVAGRKWKDLDVA